MGEGALCWTERIPERLASDPKVPSPVGEEASTWQLGVIGGDGTIPR